MGDGRSVELPDLQVAAKGGFAVDGGPTDDVAQVSRIEPYSRGDNLRTAQCSPCGRYDGVTDSYSDSGG